MTDEVFESPMAKAVYVAGGQSSLAKKVGVTQGAVWKWVRGIKKVSPVHAVAVSNAVAAANVTIAYDESASCNAENIVLTVTS